MYLWCIIKKNDMTTTLKIEEFKLKGQTSFNIIETENGVDECIYTYFNKQQANSKLNMLNYLNK